MPLQDISLVYFIAIAFATIPFAFTVLPAPVNYICRALGKYLQRRTQQRKRDLIACAAEESRRYEQQKSQLDEEWEKIEEHSHGRKREDVSWTGVIGFFHPFCNAGGGGERVLWCAIQATQQRWPKAICAVYTGDHDVNKEQILEHVKIQFNIQLHPPRIVFVYLSTRHYVLKSTWPHFTLLGQSIGSVILAYDAFTLLIPDIFIDTMGYAFAIATSKKLFPNIPTGAYIHYPTISVDMLENLASGGQGLNGGAGKGFRGAVKQYYWRLFSRMYGWAGTNVDVVMTNSSWTQAHIHRLWVQGRADRSSAPPVQVVFPPVAVTELEQQIEVSDQTEARRKSNMVYIAQFRPEKNQTLILQAFARFLHDERASYDPPPRLTFIGSVRDAADEKLIYSLRLLAHELHIKDSVDFMLNASWTNVLNTLRTSSIGVNGMWNEHFGIGVVEYQAAGLISVVHDSGGPRYDIVSNYEGQPTGFYAKTPEEFALAFKQAVTLGPEETIAMRRRARESAKRFTEEAFAEKWLEQMQKMIALQVKRSRGR